MLATPLYASVLALTLAVSASPLPTSSSSSSSSSSYTSSILSSLTGHKYAPPSECSTECAALVDDFASASCAGDACVCTAEGVKEFARCAACDTRISTYRGGVNMTRMVEDLVVLCEQQNYTMANMTLPSYSGTSLLPALTDSAETSSSSATSSSASEAIRLTSVYYASLSVAGANGFVTAEGTLPTVTASPSPSPQVVAAAAAGTAPAPSAASTGAARQTHRAIAGMAMLVACGTVLLFA